MPSSLNLSVSVFALALGMAWAAASGGEQATVVGVGFLIWLRRSRLPFPSFLLLLAIFVAGIFRYQIALNTFERGPLFQFHDERSHRIVATIADYPDVREDQLKLTLRVETVDGAASSGLLLVSLPRYPDRYFYGDRLVFEGMVEAPVEFEDFSYKNYLRRYGISSVMYEPRIVEWESCLTERRVCEGSVAKFWILRLKSAVEDRLNRLLVEPEASFAAGILLGARQGIPPDIIEDFKVTGLTHLLAISGYNITLIISFVCGLFAFLRPRPQIAVATSVIVIFVVMVGASAAVVRAALMGSLALWARWFGRAAEVTRLLVLSAGFMMVWNPFVLLDDVGFQLSFLATWGLIHLTPPIESLFERLDWFHKIPSLFSWKEAFITTLAAQVATFPILILQFDRLSLISPVANVAVVSFMPLAMLFGFLALVVSWMWWDAALAIAYVGWFFLKIILALAHLLAQVPYASI